METITPDDTQTHPSQALLADLDVTLTTLDLAWYEVANVAVRDWCEFMRVVPVAGSDRPYLQRRRSHTVYDNFARPRGEAHR
jgi:hypothetical protein